MSALTHRSALAATPAEKLWANTNRTTACWIWTAATRNGYGVIFTAGRVSYVHRVAYEMLVEPIPAGQVIDHLCRNRLCCNPAHLEPVTQRTNVMRGDTIARAHHENRDCGSDGCSNCRRFQAVAS